MNHEEYKELLALDALDALDAAERDALRAHLRDCSSCPDEGEEMRDVAAMLAYTAAPVTPPAAARARILQSISADRRTSASSSIAASSSSGDIRTLTPREERRKSRTVSLNRATLWTGALAASLVILALASAFAVVWNRSEQQRAEMARLAEREREAQQEAARVRESLQREREARDILNAPGTRITPLAGTEAAPAARATFALDQRTGRALLLTTGLPPAPAGKAYQLWFIAGGRPLPGRVFTTDEQGRALVDELVPSSGLQADAFAVTLEPAAGTSAPTGDKYLLGSAS